MRDPNNQNTRQKTFAAAVIVAATLLSGCAGPRPFSAEENSWFNIATGSDVHAVPAPSPYFVPPGARPYYPPPRRAYARPAPPQPAPDFEPVEPVQR